jgi:hypothetical protein
LPEDSAVIARTEQVAPEAKEALRLNCSLSFVSHVFDFGLFSLSVIFRKNPHFSLR